jgi:hypothetical protein
MLRFLIICAAALIAIGCDSPNQPQNFQSSPLIGTWTREQPVGKDSLLVTQLTFKADQNVIGNQKLYIKNNLTGELKYNETYTTLSDVLYLHSASQTGEYRANYIIANGNLRLIGIIDSDTSYWTKK